MSLASRCCCCGCRRHKYRTNSEDLSDEDMAHLTSDVDTPLSSDVLLGSSPTSSPLHASVASSTREGAAEDSAAFMLSVNTSNGSSRGSVGSGCGGSASEGGDAGNSELVGGRQATVGGSRNEVAVGSVGNGGVGEADDRDDGGGGGGRSGGDGSSVTSGSGGTSSGVGVLRGVLKRGKRPRTPSVGVRFWNVEVREFRMDYSDNPAVSCGIPIGLSWDFIDLDRVRIDEYEESRYDIRIPRHRFMRLGRFDRQQRLLVCLDSGMSPDEIASVTRMCDFAKHQRYESLKPDPAAALGVEESFMGRVPQLFADTIATGKVGADTIATSVVRWVSSWGGLSWGTGRGVRQRLRD